MAIFKDDIVDIELTTGTVFRSFLNRTLGEGDALANRFGVRMLKNGEAVDLTGVTCSGYFIRPTGDTVVINDGTVEGNIAYVTLPQVCYVSEGQFSLAIKLTGGNVTGTMRIVDGVVANTDTGSYVDPGTILPTIETLIATINAARETIPETYTDMQLDIQNLTGHEVFNEWVDGKAYKTSDDVIDPESPVSNSSFCCTYAECTEGETFTIYGYYGGTSNYQLYVWLDSEGNNLKRGPSTTAWYKNLEIKAPNDAAYLCVNLQKAYEHKER